MRLLVVGAGEMGRWFGRTMREGVDEEVSLAFADADPEAADAAAAALDATAVSLETDVIYDLTCFAVPIPAFEEALESYFAAGGAEQHGLVALTGEMERTSVLLEQSGPYIQRMCFHPLFAPSNAPGNVAIAEERGGEHTALVREALDGAGNDCFDTTPEEHDRVMQTVQARTHAAVLAFGLAAESVPKRFQTPVSAALLETLAEVTGNDPGTYADIQETFAGAEDVADAARRIADADRETFERLYREAGEPVGDQE